METLAAVGLAGNIVQFVDFSGKLISKSKQLYHHGTLDENVDIETATKHLVVLNKKFKEDAISVGDRTLQNLALSCQNAANDLLKALDKVKVKDKQQKWESVRKALRSVWSKDEIDLLEQRLAKLKDDLNLHAVVQLREQFSRFKREQLDEFERLDLATKSILDAITERKDIFQAAHEAHITLTKTLHESTTKNINDTRQEISDTRREIIREIRLPQPDIAQREWWLDKLSNATQAAFNSSERQHDPMCLENTRVGVLNDIREWANGQDERRIYWLNGLAGTGKSTIARTIAREYYEHGRLGASFFFSKGGGDVGHTRKFFTTIAFQLAKRSSSLKSYICSAISENSDIMDQSLHDQWHQLILQPLSRLDGNSSQSSYILVVDALDECEGENNIRAVLRLLAEVRALKKVQLRVLLTSRPDIPIRHGFHQISDAHHQGFVLHNLSPSIKDHDIRIFLEYEFKDIGQERFLDSGWSDKQIIERLIQKASGLFIWAATACRFVRDGKQVAGKRLAMILEDNIDNVTVPEKHPEKRLDEIYVTVLRQPLNFELTGEEREYLYRMLRHILGSIVVLFSPLSADSLCRLLHVSKEDVGQTLEDLHAILDIPKDQTRPLRLHHPSFRDFLISKERCKDPNFWIAKKQAHQILADNSIRLMANSLKQDICSLDNYGVFVTDIDSSQVRQCLPEEVQYACLYWIQHLQKSGSQLHDNDQVHQFLQAHLLHWLEALSWMRKVSEGINAITVLESIALASNCSILYAFIHDIKRFALYSRPAFDQTPLQVYCSALAFAPIMSIVRKQFETRKPRWIKRLPEAEKNWNAALQTLEGHSESVHDVAFSPDGKVLASASCDQTVKLWEAGTGAALQTLEGHSDWVNAVAFSPDGKVLASASDDTTVKLWDAGTGAAPQTLEGHLNQVEAIAFSPDGKVLASASDDRTVKLWEAGTGAALQTLEGHSNWVNAVAFSPDGKVLASASGDRTVKLWEAGTGAALQTLEGHSDFVNAVAFSPDGKVLASASQDTTVKLWDAGTGAALQMLEGHSTRVKVVAFSPDGKVLASASCDQTVKLWEAGTGAALQTLEGHSDWVNAVAFSPDGKVLASASDDTTVKLWDAGTGAAPQTLEGHLNQVEAIAFSPDGKVLASASDDRTVKLWEAGTGAALQTLEGHSNWVNAVAFSPDGKVLASASGDRTVKLWEAGTGAALQTLEGHSDFVNAVAFSPDGKVLASASQDTTVKLWDAGTGAALQMLEGHSTRVKVVAFSPDGKVLASASKDKVTLWDAGTGAALSTLGHSDTVEIMAFSPDGKVLVSASNDLTVKLWKAGTGAALQTLEGHSDWVNAVAFSPDGKVLASASHDRTVKLWEAGTGAALQTLEGHSDFVNAVAFSPDGKVLASASQDTTVKLWDAGTGAALQMLEGHSTRVKVVAFSPDGKVLASASCDQTVKLWEAGTGAALQTLEGHSDWVNAVAFSPDGKVLASASDDTTVKLWDAGTGVALQTLEGHSSCVEDLAFSPDGKVLASASDDRTVKLWEAGTGAALQTLEGHSDWVNAVAFSPDGKVLASVSDDTTVKLWDAGTGAALQTVKLLDAGTGAVPQTLEIHPIIQTMSFTDDGKFLDTNRGLLSTTSVSPSESPSRRSLSRELFVKDQWITRGMENLIWLPYEYRTSCIAVHGNVVAIGHASGRLAILEFEF